MKKLVFTLISIVSLSTAHSQVKYKKVATNAVRIQYGNTQRGISDCIYVKNNEIDNTFCISAAYACSRIYEQHRAVALWSNSPKHHHSLHP